MQKRKTVIEDFAFSVMKKTKLPYLRGAHKVIRHSRQQQYAPAPARQENAEQPQGLQLR